MRELIDVGVRKIIVCDDASTDGTVEHLVEKYGDSITVIQGGQNLGPGGNRNRCIPFIDSEDEVLLFLDADCELIASAEELADAIAYNFDKKDTGVVGFSILNQNDHLMNWNYGNLMHPVHEAADQKLESMLNRGIITTEQFKQGAPDRAASCRLLPETEPKEVGWVAEGCFAVRAHLYKRLGGFASSMRYHETHDFNARVQKLGFKTIFCPLIAARHAEHDSRLERRADDERLGRLYYYQQHWGMSEGVFMKLSDE